MGLLDQFNGMDDAQTQGLLAAASQMLQQSGPSLRPTSLGQIIGGGLGAWQEGTYAAKKRKLDEEQARQMAELRGLQIKDATGSLQDHDTARAEAERYRNYLMGAGNPAAQTDAPMPQSTAPMASSAPGGAMSPKVGGPDWMQAYQAQAPSAPMSAPQGAQAAASAAPAFGSYEYMMAKAQDLMRNGFPAQAQAMMKEAVAARPKFSTDFRVGRGADGKMHNYQLSDDGAAPRDSGVDVASELHFGDTGGALVGMDKYTGKVLASTGKTVTPGETLVDARARQQLAQSAERLKFDKAQADKGDDEKMDPLAIRMTAQQYLAGDTGALANFGRGAQGAANLNAVRLEIAKQANSAGLNGADIAAKVAEFSGLKAGQRTAGVRSASIEIAANEVAQLAPIALEASAKVARSGIHAFGKAQIMFDSGTNDPNMRQFAMANTALVNAYGQAMARGGAATVSDKDHARELLSTTFDQPSYAAAVAQLQKETRAAQAAPKQVRKDLSDAVSGRETAPAAPAPKKSAIKGQVVDGYRFKGGDPASQANWEKI